MNQPLDFNSCEDFVNMSSTAVIRPNRSIEIRNVSGDQVRLRPYMDQARILCKNNDTNLLSLLTRIQDKINKDMLVRGNNVPLFKQKVSSVIAEWPYNVSYEDIFSSPESVPFDYNDLMKCNAVIIGLDGDMLDLEKQVAEESDSLYSSVTNLQGKCLEAGNEINTCMRNIDQISEDYEPKFPKIFMDLSTRQKPYYTSCDNESSDKLNDMVYRKGCNEIPDNIPDIFGNAIMLPNMISKETEYTKSILQNLHKNVRNKQLILSKLIENVPEKRKTYFIDSFQRLIKSMIDSSEEEYSDEEGGGEDDEGGGEDDEGGSDDEGGVGDDEGVEIEVDVIDYSPQLNSEDREDIEKTLGEIRVEELEEPERKLVDESKKTKGGKYELSFF